MPEQQMATSSPEADLESLPADGGNGAQATDFRAENQRLRQELAKVKALNRDAVPLANYTLQLKEAIRRQPEGAAIIQKLLLGEPLSAKEEKQVDKATESSPATQGLSIDQVQALLDQSVEKIAQRFKVDRESERNWDKLHERAAKEFPGYEDFRHDDEWQRRVNLTFAYINEGLIPVPDDEPDPYWFALKEAFATVKKEVPDVGKLRRAPKSEDERKGAILKASQKSAAAAPDEENLSEEQAFARRPIRGRGIGGVGLSLQQLRARP